MKTKLFIFLTYSFQFTHILYKKVNTNNLSNTYVTYANYILEIISNYIQKKGNMKI